MFFLVKSDKDYTFATSKTNNNINYLRRLIMKKLFLMAAMVLSSVGAFAQHSVGSVTLQPRVGVNIADLTDLNDSKVRVGLAAGAELEYQATDLFSVSAGVLYSMQGAKLESSNVTTTAKLDYVNIPIMANVYVAKGLAVKVGVQPGFNVNSEVEASVLGHNGSVKADAKSFDFAIPVGVSYEYSNVVLDARYNWGLTKTYEYGDSKNSVFQITLGYKFEL